MNRKPSIYLIKLNSKVLILMALILFLIIGITIFKSSKVLKIFSYRTKETIVIDPGHGGIDGGTGDPKDILEKDINLDIGLKLKKELLVEGFNVIMTREKDESLEDLSNINSSRYRRDLNARQSIINSSKPLVYVSIHVNSSKSPSARGVKVYHFPGSEEGKKLAEAISSSVDIYLYEKFLKDDNLISEVLSENFYILRETKYTGVLVEAGFITNVEDNRLLKDDKYKEKLAFAIKKGILEYLK
ncbi:Cell wall hydrolase/autolysin [[Clostridium] ultunense Esp]|uniref:Cell wall hydrolase/autolysin n=1 Tax=[Clostridium] ultunense Esp TaxID=1288971 RepID=M1ZFK1_9FIRM|nr:N-acetylmuramoyl-L-alanine amidase [Schnuerera ultunensis]CCQ97511.1 Cell wall hydrolase/autolysin [[Clostridium] ultunense Esp]SHD76117.1 Cell wall hydrolase/autolysin [[Clostridium] ultunense Esp]